MEFEKTLYGHDVPVVLKIVKRDDECTCLRNSSDEIISYDPWCLSPLKFKHGKKSTKRVSRKQLRRNYEH